jgi:hypothetical protein
MDGGNALDTKNKGNIVSALPMPPMENKNENGALEPVISYWRDWGKHAIPPLFRVCSRMGALEKCAGKAWPFGMAHAFSLKDAVTNSFWLKM